MDALPIYELTQEHLPRRWGRYELQRVVGQGSVARVFKADLLGPGGFRQPVALKALTSDHPQLRELMEREAYLGTRLKHNNIVRTFEMDRENDRIIIAMEYVDGLTAGQLLGGWGRLPGASVLELVAQTARGLAWAHSASLGGRRACVVHQDIKPSNLLVDTRGRVRIADFGIARVLEPGEKVTAEGWGSPGYAAPEQWRRQAIDHRVDVFALGVVLLTLLSGKRPWPTENYNDTLWELEDPEAALARRRLDKVVEEAAPGSLELLLSCLSPDPDQRPADLGGVADRLLALQLKAQPGPSLTRMVGEVLGRPEPSQGPVVGSLGSGGPVQAQHQLGFDEFVGRHQELRKLDEDLGSAVPALLLMGLPGIGKSQLAARFAGRWEELGRSKLVCELDQADSAEGLLRVVAASMDMALAQASDEDSHREAIGEALAARGRVLVVLDGLEGVPEQVAEMLPRWIQQAPRARFLLTSRQRPPLDTLAVMPVPPLSSSEAEALFVARARRVRPDFDPSVDPTGIKRLIRKLEGVPLAIELAAGQVYGRSPTDVASHLSQKPSENPLRAAVRHSWSLLESWQQACLAQLSVTRGGFSLRAAEAIVELSDWPRAPWVAITLQQLHDRSLLRLVQGGDSPRFAMFATVRDIAGRALRQPGAVLAPNGRSVTGPSAYNGAVNRHGEHYARLGSPGTVRLLSRRGGLHQLQRLGREWDNLIATARRAARNGDGTLSGRAALAAWALAERRGPLLPTLALLQQALAAPGLTPSLRQSLLHARATANLTLGRRKAGAADLTASLTLARELGKVREEALLLRLAARERRRQGDARGSRRTLEHAERLAREVGDQQALAVVLNSLAVFRMEHVGRKESLPTFTEALNCAKGAGDALMEARVCGNLGLANHLMGSPEVARSWLKDATELNRQLGAVTNLAFSLGALAAVEMEAGQLRKAMGHYQEVLPLFHQSGDRAQILYTYLAQGVAWLLLGDLDDAVRINTLALKRGERMGMPQVKQMALMGLARCHARRGQLEQAHTLLLRSSKLAEGLGQRMLRAEVLARMGPVLAGLGKLPEAEGALKKAEGMLRTGDGRFLLGQVLCKRANLALMRDDMPRAQGLMNEAMEIRVALGAGEASELGQAMSSLEMAMGLHGGVETMPVG